MYVSKLNQSDCSTEPGLFDKISIHSEVKNKMLSHWKKDIQKLLRENFPRWSFDFKERINIA